MCNIAGIIIPICWVFVVFAGSSAKNTLYLLHFWLDQDLNLRIVFCDASPWFAQSPGSSVGSSFALSRKSGWTKWNKHYCVQIIWSCRISWGRMGPLRLRGDNDFRFITVGRLMKQTHQGCLGRYLKLYLIFTTIYMKMISRCVVSGRISDSIQHSERCSQSPSQCVLPAAYSWFSDAAFAKSFICLVVLWEIWWRDCLMLAAWERRVFFFSSNRGNIGKAKNICCLHKNKIQY